MADTVNLNIRIDRELKESADAFFQALGLNTTTAITLFMRQSLREQRIPFELRLAPFAAFGPAYLDEYRTSLRQMEEGRVIAFDSIDDLLKLSKEHRYEDPVH
jgi:DNA-damage-inducible protein J